MKRKIFIGIGVFLVLIVGSMAYLNNRNRTLSPLGEANISNNDFEISVKYSRPSVRDRMIFGTEAAGALQPFGKYWRLGANEATEVTFNKEVRVVDASLAAGTYAVYATPGEGSFEIFFNTALGNWGAFEPDHSRDVASVIVPTEQGEKVEQVLVDGKPYFGDDPKSALKNIPARIVQKVQMFDDESDEAKATIPHLEHNP